MNASRVAQFAIAAAFVATFIVIGAWTVRVALADQRFRQETLTGTQEALRLEPDYAAYFTRLAAILQGSNPAGSAQALRRAVALNPWDSASWIELGLRAEGAGDLAGAERSLLRSASVDKQYLPRWSLANYYFRHSDAEKFWFWARQATLMAYGDLAPLFNLCWKVTSDGALIEQRLKLSKADLELKYVTYLTSQNRIEPMTRAAMRLFAWNRESDVPVLLDVCDRLIADNRPDPSIQIWNKLAELRRIPFEGLAPRSGRSLTNGDFRIFPTSRGFDWYLPGTAGIAASIAKQPEGLRISFSGRQPETCDVLTEVLPLVEKSDYEIRYLYYTTGIAPGTGLGWRILDLTGTRIFAQGDSLASESETEGTLTFRTPAGAGLVRLALSYQRALGTTRIEGFIVLHRMRLAQAPGMPEK